MSTRKQITFFKAPSLFIWYAKKHKNRLNLSFWKTQIKNITNTHINRFGPPLRGSKNVLCQDYFGPCVKKSFLRLLTLTHLKWRTIRSLQTKLHFFCSWSSTAQGLVILYHGKSLVLPPGCSILSSFFSRNSLCKGKRTVDRAPGRALFLPLLDFFGCTQDA